MGLDDLLPEGVDKDSSSSQSRSTTSQKQTKSDEDFAQVVTGPDGEKKRFTEEQWEKVQRVIEEHFDYSPNEVIHNLPASERYSIVHKAVLFDEGEAEEDDLSARDKIECASCGADCGAGYVELEGEKFCVSHTAAQVATELGKEIQDVL